MYFKLPSQPVTKPEGSPFFIPSTDPAKLRTLAASINSGRATPDPIEEATWQSLLVWFMSRLPWRLENERPVGQYNFEHQVWIADIIRAVRSPTRTDADGVWVKLDRSLHDWLLNTIKLEGPWAMRQVSPDLHALVQAAVEELPVG